MKKLIFISLISIFLTLNIDGSLAKDLEAFNKIMQEGHLEVSRAEQTVLEAPKENEKNVEEREKLMYGVLNVLTNEIDAAFNSTVAKSVAEKKVAAKHLCIATAVYETLERMKASKEKFTQKGAEYKKNSRTALVIYEGLFRHLKSFLAAYEVEKKNEMATASSDLIVLILQEALGVVEQLKETANQVVKSVVRDRFKFFELYVHLLHETENSFKWSHANGLKKLTKCLQFLLDLSKRVEMGHPKKDIPDDKIHLESYKLQTGYDFFLAGIHKLVNNSEGDQGVVPISNSSQKQI